MERSAVDAVNANPPWVRDWDRSRIMKKLHFGFSGILKMGVCFYRADNKVWLTDEVPASYLGFGMT